VSTEAHEPPPTAPPPPPPPVLPPVDLAPAVRAAGFGTVRKAPLAAVPSEAPSRLRAVVATDIVTLLPYGSALAGSKTRTVSSSANVTLPATAAFPARTLKAAFVDALSIGWVKRTEI